jgi:hypothetical protein
MKVYVEDDNNSAVYCAMCNKLLFCDNPIANENRYMIGCAGPECPINIYYCAECFASIAPTEVYETLKPYAEQEFIEPVSHPTSGTIGVDVLTRTGSSFILPKIKNIYCPYCNFTWAASFATFSTESINAFLVHFKDSQIIRCGKCGQDCTWCKLD